MKRIGILLIIILFITPVVNCSSTDQLNEECDYFTNVQESIEQGWTYLESFPNYAPNGLPDFSQKQHKWRYIIDGGNGIVESTAKGDDVQIAEYGKKISVYGSIIAMGPNCYLDTTPGGDDLEYWNFCFLVSLANCFWWLDSKYDDPHGTPGDGVDSYPLVEDYGVGDDHAPENAPLLVCDLAHMQGIPCYNKSFSDLGVYLEEWMIKKGLGNMYKLTTYMNPTFGYIAEEIKQNKPVILNINLYKKSGEDYYYDGNHFVSCAGVNIEEMKLAFSDPFLNNNTPTNNESSHNNANNVSRDIYQIELGSPLDSSLRHPEYGWIKFWLPDYWPYYDICIVNQATVVNQINNTHDPPSISGSRIGRIGKTIDYTFQSTDPDVSEVSYYIDWGDNNASGWTRYRSSNDPLIIPYTWEQESIYSIKAKIKDKNGSQSNWGELQVIIPKERSVFSFLYQRVIQRFPILRLISQMIGFETNYYINEDDCDYLVNSYSNPFPLH